MNARRVRIAAIVVVLAGAFYTSFNDIVHAAQLLGQPLHVALAYPVVIDAGILAAALTLVANVGVNRSARVYAKAGRWLGVGATIYANALSAATTDVNAIIMRVIPALMLIATAECLVHSVRGTTTTRARKNSRVKHPVAVVQKLNKTKVPAPVSPAPIGS